MPGQYLDRETNLHYNHHRYYDPKIGGYINQDPIGLFGGLNCYIYVNGGPVNNIDPDGLINPSGQWKDCGNGCKIRIEGNHNDTSKRHLHWECRKGGKHAMGEFGDISHGEDYTTAPNSIKECARKYGFEPEPPPKPENPTSVSCPNSAPKDTMAGQQNTGFIDKISELTGLTGAALVIYLIISEGSRLFPPRDLVPVP